MQLKKITELATTSFSSCSFDFFSSVASNLSLIKSSTFVEYSRKNCRAQFQNMLDYKHIRNCHQWRIDFGSNCKATKCCQIRSTSYHNLSQLGIWFYINKSFAPASSTVQRSPSCHASMPTQPQHQRG